MKREKTFIGLFIWSQVIFHLFLQIVPLFVVVSGESKMRLRNGMWHGLRHGIIMRTCAYILGHFLHLSQSPDNLPQKGWT